GNDAVPAGAVGKAGKAAMVGKAGVERAIRVVPADFGTGERIPAVIDAGINIDAMTHNDFAVALHGNAGAGAVGSVIVIHYAACAERWIERTIGVESRQAIASHIIL